MELELYRAKIDAIDAAILKLIHERMEIAEVIGTIKQAAKLPMEDRVREEEILKRLEKLNNGKMDNEHLKTIFEMIIYVCLQRQKISNGSRNR